ncbi:MAG: hypothetical protein Fur0041_15550 [Bacteroidia bacterium]
MKKVHYLLLSGVLLLSMAFTMSSVCNENQFFVAGTTSKINHYNGKQKLEGVSNAKVLKVYQSADTTVAEVESAYSDEKGKEQYKGTVVYKCINGKIIMDLQKMLRDGQPQQQGKDMTTQIEGNLVEYSPGMTAGQSLPDVNMTMKMLSNGAVMSTMKMRLYDRKVEAKESRTTPAGTFDCYKIVYMMEASAEFGAMKMPVFKGRKTVEWFSFSAGAVRSEFYNGDKLESVTELAELKKP